MMSIRSLAAFNRSSLGGDGDWLTPPPSPPRPHKPGRHDERGMGTFNWPPARTSTWPYTGTFSWPRTTRELEPLTCVNRVQLVARLLVGRYDVLPLTTCRAVAHRHEQRHVAGIQDQRR